MSLVSLLPNSNIMKNHQGHQHTNLAPRDLMCQHTKDHMSQISRRQMQFHDIDRHYENRQLLKQGSNKSPKLIILSPPSTRSDLIGWVWISSQAPAARKVDDCPVSFCMEWTRINNKKETTPGPNHHSIYSEYNEPDASDDLLLVSPRQPLPVLRSWYIEQVRHQNSTHHWSRISFQLDLAGTLNSPFEGWGDARSADHPPTLGLDMKYHGY